MFDVRFFIIILKYLLYWLMCRIKYNLVKLLSTDKIILS